MNKPRIIFWDLETSLIQATTFTLRPDYLPHNGIIQDWSIISGAWKVQGEKKVNSVKVKKYGDDKELVQKLRGILESGDIIVHHNGDRFDIRKFNARLIYHGLQPLPPLTTVDTLKEVKKIAQFTSNRLDYLGQHLCGEGKIHTSSDLWLKVIYGDKKALNEMVTYNEQDVLLLEKVYNKLLPYMKKHPHVGVIARGVKCDCPRCGSVKMEKNGVRITTTGNKQQRLKCKDCGSWHSVPLKEVK